MGIAPVDVWWNGSLVRVAVQLPRPVRGLSCFSEFWPNLTALMISRIAPTFSWIGQLCPVRNQVWRLMFRSARSAQKRHCDGSMPRLRMASVLKERPSAAIDMRAVLDTADIEHPVVLERAECDAVIAAARHTPAFELEPQRL